MDYRGELGVRCPSDMVEDKRDEAVFNTEVYLNGDVANEVFRKYGIYIRVHLVSGPVLPEPSRPAGWILELE